MGHESDLDYDIRLKRQIELANSFADSLLPLLQPSDPQKTKNFIEILEVLGENTDCKQMLRILNRLDSLAVCDESVKCTIIGWCISTRLRDRSKHLLRFFDQIIERWLPPLISEDNPGIVEKIIEDDIQTSILPMKYPYKCLTRDTNKVYYETRTLLELLSYNHLTKSLMTVVSFSAPEGISTYDKERIWFHACYLIDNYTTTLMKEALELLMLSFQNNWLGFANNASFDSPFLNTSGTIPVQLVLDWEDFNVIKDSTYFLDDFEVSQFMEAICGSGLEFVQLALSAINNGIDGRKLIDRYAKYKLENSLLSSIDIMKYILDETTAGDYRDRKV